MHSVEVRLVPFADGPGSAPQNNGQYRQRTCDSRAMEVVSPPMALAMPKSISLSCPSTTRKLAGLRSLCTMRALCIVATACTAPSPHQ